MFEKFLNTGTNTFNQRYNNTYGMWVDNVNKIRKLVKITAISEDNGSLSFVDSRGVKSTLYSDVKEDMGFEFVPPIRRWYPHKTYGAVLGYRVPAHQFRRGLCDDNYSVVYFDKNLIRRGLNLTFELLDQLLFNDPKPPHSLESFLDFTSTESKTNTFYVSPQLALHKTSPTIMYLMVYDRPIATGRYMKGRKVFSLTEVNQMFAKDCDKLSQYITGLTVEAV